ncbi:MAG TPA: LysR family transcriptional regulator [Holophaga sp.]|nr:LysR family transcriptional regulator [Holophaga sp.]
MRFDLMDLRLFLRVAEAGSITHGATQANLALPSASARLRAMEEMIGLPLLARKARGVELTPAGSALVHHARIILRQVDQMQGEMGEYARGFKTQVRLLANTSAMNGLLPERLAPFLADHPNVEVDLKERPSKVIVQAVAAEYADLGIVSDAVDAGGLERRPFAVDHLLVAVAADHPLARLKRVAFQDTLAEPWVGLPQGNPLQELLREHAVRAGQAPAFRVRVPTFEAMGQMVQWGVGLGFMPETAARKCSRSLTLRALPLAEPWATRGLSLCMRSYADLGVKVRELVDRLGEPGTVQ